MAKDQNIVIPKPDIKIIKVKINGTAPLIFHRWDEKAIKMMLDKQMKKASSGREAKDPEKDARNSFYVDSRGKIAFPALSIKQALVNAVRSLSSDIKMTMLRGVVFVQGDKEGFIPVLTKGKEVTLKDFDKNVDTMMRQDQVRVGMGTADIRFRGQLIEWSMDLQIKFLASKISAEQVINLLQYAGFSCGLGEWRPERNGSFGTFEVETE